MRPAAFLAILILGGCASNPVQPASVPSILEEALTWLPPDTETLIVAKGPFPISIEEDHGGENEPALEEVLRALAMGGLGGIREGALIKTLAGKTVTLALEGSRNFRRPTGLGSFRYQGAAVLALKEGSDLDALMKEVESAAEERREERGLPVFIVREMWEKDEWTFYIARPRPDLLVCATDRNYLCELLDRRTRSSKTRALPPDLPEWKLLDPAATCWAVRHYDRRKEQDYYAESFPDDKTAQGLVFFAARDGKSAKIRVLSESRDTSDRLAEAFHRPGEGLESRIEHDGRIAEVTSPCDSHRAVHYFVFALLGFLGHAIFL